MATVSRHSIASSPEDQGRRKTLGRDLAEELGFPADTNLAKISQVELHGVSWQNPYKRLLWRCIHHSLLKPFSSSSNSSSTTRARSPSPTPSSSPRRSYDSEDERMAVPTNPPPSPAVGPVDRLSKVSVTIQEIPCDDLEPYYPCSPDDRNNNNNNSSCNIDNENVTEQYYRRGNDSSNHDYASDSPLPAAGFLAAIRAEDGTLTWHFKDLS